MNTAPQSPLSLMLSQPYDGPKPFEAWDNIFGLGKKAKARKEEKFKMKMETKASKNRQRDAKSEARVTLANQGIKQTSGVADAIGGVFKGVAGIFGGGQPAEDTTAYTPPILPALPALPAPAAPAAATTQQMLSQPTASTPVQEMMSAGGGYGNSIAGDTFQDTSALSKNLFQLLPEKDVKNKKGNNTLLIVGIVVVVLVIVIVAFKRKK